MVALANSKKNRNIKAYNVNFISMARSTDFCFKTKTNRSIVCCFQCFVRGSSPFGKVVSHETPLPLGNYCPWTPPSPSEFPMVRGGYGYFLEPHIIVFGLFVSDGQVKCTMHAFLKTLHCLLCVVLDLLPRLTCRWSYLANDSSSDIRWLGLRPQWMAHETINWSWKFDLGWKQFQY